MGGSLEAEDTPGGGLTMVLTLPRAEPGQVPDLPAAVDGEALHTTTPVHP
jgi:two-component system sensor histidine kinase KdpD